MSAIEKTIGELKSSLSTSFDENFLAETLAAALEELRQLWRENKGAFSVGDVTVLSGLREICNALQDFQEIREEVRYVRSRDDAQAILSQLVLIRDVVSDFPVSKRVEKEMREVSEQFGNLPFEADVKAIAEQNARWLKLGNDAKPCAKCGAKMVVREGPNGLFLGCSTFPACFSKRALSAEQRNFLDSD